MVNLVRTYGHVVRAGQLTDTKSTRRIVNRGTLKTP